MDAYIFVPLLAFSWVYGLLLSGLLAHFFLTIVECSGTLYAQNIGEQHSREYATGRDGIDWPDVTYLDWFWKGIYMLYLVALWLVPAYALARIVMGSSPWTSVAAGVAFWLLFPVGVLSTVMSGSHWTAFWPPLLGAMAKRPVQTASCYLLSALPLAVMVLMFDLLFIHPGRLRVAWLLALTPIAMLAMFVYARLLGRLALALSFTMEREEIKPAETYSMPDRPKKKRKKRPIHAYDETTRWSMPTESIDHIPGNVQPDELPAIETPEGPVTGYGIDYSNRAVPDVPTPPTPRLPRLDDEEDDTPLTAAPPPELNTDERRRATDQLAKPPEHVMKLYRRDRPKEPANPFGGSVVSFLLEPPTAVNWVLGSAGLALMTVMVAMLVALRPPLEQ